MEEEDIANVYLLIKNTEDAVKKKRLSEELYKPQHKIYNDNVPTKISNIEQIFTPHKIQLELLKYELAMGIPTNIVVDKIVLNSDTKETVCNIIKNTLDKFTPILFPHVLEDKEWSVQLSSSAIFAFSPGKILFVNSANINYDAFTLNEFLQLVILYLSKMIDTTIKYKIVRDVNYKMVWTIIYIYQAPNTTN